MRYCEARARGFARAFGLRQPILIEPAAHRFSLAADILSETLYLAGVWPFARCGDLQDDDWAQLHSAASDVIQRVRGFRLSLAQSLLLHAPLLTLPAS